MPIISRSFIHQARCTVSNSDPAPVHFLWVIDESFAFEPNDFDSLLAAIDPNNVTVTILTNRYSLVLLGYANSKKNIRLHVSDFDFSSLEQEHYDGIFYRVSKEKPVVHHILNNVIHHLKPQASLIIAGRKNEGTKTYIDKVKKVLGLSVSSKKEGDLYFGTATATTEPNALLDDSEYTKLRDVAQLHGKPVQSKPGVYGWKKFDAATAMLIELIEQTHTSLAACSVLDLGCGSGYLAIAVRTLGCTKLVATDNNVAAVHTTEHNLKKLNLFNEGTTVIADDCAQSIADRFDLVVCNPPFHKGFDTSRELSNLFLHQAATRLTPNGKALFVVNSFIPLEKLAAPYFKKIECLQNNNSFKIIQLAQ